MDHTGVKIELIGQIELFFDRGNHYQFSSLLQELAPSGDIEKDTSFPFEFTNAEKPHESYNGTNVRLRFVFVFILIIKNEAKESIYSFLMCFAFFVRLIFRYFLRFTVLRGGFSANYVTETDIWVYNVGTAPEINTGIKMEVGIEDFLHIEFEYNKSKYNLKDAIVGKVYFLLIRIPVKYMELSLIKKESTGAGINQTNNKQTNQKPNNQSIKNKQIRNEFVE